jgi:hypothetical protein
LYLDKISAMSEAGQSGYFDLAPVTSGLPQQADNRRGDWLFSKVPKRHMQRSKLKLFDHVVGGANQPKLDPDRLVEGLQPWSPMMRSGV